jgi:hypothetical protein
MKPLFESLGLYALSSQVKGSISFGIRRRWLNKVVPT